MVSSLRRVVTRYGLPALSFFSRRRVGRDSFALNAVMRAMVRGNLIEVKEPVRPCAAFHHRSALEILQPVSNKYSDHSSVLHRLIGNKLILIANTMMQGVNTGERINTAYGENESTEQYRARLSRQILLWGSKIRDNPNIVCLMLQEAPVAEDFAWFKEELLLNLPDDWQVDNLYIDNSKWGVVTVINTKELAASAMLKDYTEAIDIDEISERFRSVEMTDILGNTRTLSNLHLPHGAPQEAFREILKNVLRESLDSSIYQDGGEIEHDFIGDYNLSPEEINELCTEVLESDEFKKHHSLWNIGFEFYSSESGHLKFNGSRISVDGALSIKIKQSQKDEKHYRFRSESFDYNMLLTLLTAVIFSSDSFSDNKANQQAQVEQSDKSYQVFKP